MITTANVADYLDLKNRTDPHLQVAVDAVNALVSRLPDIHLDEDPTDPALTVWAPDTKLGAIMLGARIWKRRNSPNGIEALNEGGATYVSRYDSDIARMLRIDGYELPRVG